MATVALAIYKLTKPVVVAAFYFCHLLYSNHHAAKVKDIEPTDPIVLRYQGLIMRRLLKGSIHAKKLTTIQCFVVAFSSWVLFFSSSKLDDLTHVLPIASAMLIFLLGYLATFGVQDRTSLLQFAKSSQGVSMAVSLGLFVCFLVGTLHLSDLLHRQPLVMSFDGRTCELIPLFPVSGGEMFFFPDVSAFGVVRQDGTLLMYHQTNKLPELPSCWM
ncbi:hypothetical protein [Ruegeria atlantica]|uniref:hypothetical protein n=1 Tax=Ruegeria atlantica TaxID=81569 RepID=UPI001479BEA6|nr:hypothetical protein [Ruegeria atlantica]